MDQVMHVEFWVAVSQISQIILIDTPLGGDNAVVIALACHRLRPTLRTMGIHRGTAGAIVLRVFLIFSALARLDGPGALPEVLAQVRDGAVLAGALLVLSIGLLLERRAAEAAY